MTLTLYVNGGKVGGTVDSKGTEAGPAGVVLNGIEQTSGGKLKDMETLFDDFVVRHP